MELLKDTKPEPATAESASTEALTVGSASTSGRPLFDEMYDDWSSFDAAIARATAAYHPIRKRSSLTFEVYNRTVSKGKHDRKNIAEFLSKTFKCTHGIKFRSRGNGKRLRHRLRDIGCPFHVYASAVEYGPNTYRVRVRTHEKHNHPIGPDSMKMMSGALHESDYELAPQGGSNDSTSERKLTGSTTASTHIQHTETVVSPENAADVAQTAYERQIKEQLEEADAHVCAQVRTQTEAQTQANDQSQAYQYTNSQEFLKLEGMQAMIDAQRTLRTQQNILHVQPQPPPVDATHILNTSSHDSELLEEEIDSTISDDIFESSSASQTATTDVKVAINSNVQALSCNGFDAPGKFEATMTFESLRKRIANFADERDWNQFHTPRNLLLALNGEVGELCEIFQWKGEVKNTADWTAREKEHLGEEISDVLIYLVRLADKCDVNLPAALNDKIAKNARKYPADMVRGSSKKYNEYKRLRTV